MNVAPGVFELGRAVPVGSSVAVQVGDRVASDTVIAIGHLDRRVLRLPPGDNFELLKKPGDPIKKGETLAVMEELLGLGLRELVSPCDGLVESVNPRRTGIVVTGSDREIRALVPGLIQALGPSEIRLSVTGHRLQGFFGFGQPASGKLWMAGELYTASEVKRRLGPAVEGQVVLADSFVLPEVLPILGRYRAAGFICGGLDFGPLWDLISPAGPFPAGRGLPTLVVLGGFGPCRIGSEDRDILGRAEGKRVYVAGPTAGRLVFAGPPHPEVVVA